MQGTLNISVLPNASIKLQQKIPPISPEDCLIVSFPRSGNTWVRFLLANLLEDSRYPLTFKQMQNKIPSIHCKKQWDRIRTMTEPRYIKSHMPYCTDYQKVIYVVRDGRDVMVSSYNYYYSSNQISFLDFLQLDVWPGRWYAHVLSWLKNAHRLDLLLIRYEDLLRDPFEQLKNIAHFIGLNMDNVIIDRAVRYSSFAAMKIMEASLTDSHLELVHPSRFFRAGKSGLWRQYFGAEHKAVFKPNANPVLLRLGYVSDTNW
jgi:hypothetical protein